MATLLDLTTRVQQGFGDENEAVVSATEIHGFINEAIREVAKLTEIVSVQTVSITTTDADGMIALPTDYLKMKEIRYNNQIIPMIPRSIILSRYTEPQQGEPIGWYPYDYTRIQLWPIKASATGLSLQLRYVSFPSDISVNTDVPSLPLIVHDALVDYAVHKCYMKVADTTMANYALGRFQQKVTDFIYLRDNQLEGVSATVSDTEAEYVIQL